MQKETGFPFKNVLGLSLILVIRPVLAQKTPLSATLTNPSSQTVRFDPKQKIPPFAYNLPCKMSNGVDDRPFPCEFTFDKLEIFGKNGALLSTITAKNPTVSLPLNQAKATPSAAVATYSAKAYFTRINPPAFPVQKGYLIERSSGVQGTKDGAQTLLTGIVIDNKIGTKKVVPFDLTWPHNTDGDALFTLHIENDVTTDHFIPKPGTVVTMHDKAEASMTANPKLVSP